MLSAKEEKKEREGDCSINKPQILFEDNCLIAVNKPSGMVVNRGFGVEGSTLQDWVEEYLVISDIPVYRKYSDKDFCQRSGIIHRLDKETSGVVLVAKTPEVFRALQRQFKDREVEKVYVVLVHGKVEPAEGVINAPTGRLPWRRTRFGVVEGGREAGTEYRVVSVFGFRVPGSGYQVSEQQTETRQLETDTWHPAPEIFSLVEFYPRTGRTHQIRVHAKHIGHPIVGDTLYAGRKTARRDRTWCPRLFLHAQKLMFTHPVGGKRMTVEAPLPKELAEVLEHLI